MTKKKPSPQNRIWEKERRERLNKTFEDLQRLLPDHEPASTFSKVEILQRAIELIGELQKKIKDVLEKCNDPLKEHVKEQEQRLKRLLARNEELAALLRKAKINVPPCKYTMAEEELQRQNEEKENGNRPKKPETKPRRSGNAPKKQPVIVKKPPTSAVDSETIALSIVKNISTTSIGVNCCPSDVQSAPCPPALRHINGNGVTVTPALLPTPIMTTSVLISNNGSLVQVPIVAPPSSLLIVGNEDVRSKINLKNRPLEAASTRYRGKRGKFTIKSIDLIPGRIVNGKIPIPPLRRSTSEIAKSVKASKLKRRRSLEKCKKPRKAKAIDKKNLDKSDAASNAKRARLQQGGKSTMESSLENKEQIPNPPNEGITNASSSVPIPYGSDAPEVQGKNVELHLNDASHETHLGMGLAQHATDLPEDIFANLQVPDDVNPHGSNEDGTLSPTAAYLMNFPLVAGGGKAAGNHVDTGESDECPEALVNDQQTAKNGDASLTNVPETGSMVLDSFASYFNYGHMDTMMAGNSLMNQQQQDSLMLNTVPVPTVTAATIATTTIATLAPISTITTPRDAGFTNFPTIYQSIDNMLDHRQSGTTNRTATSSGGKAHTTEVDFPASVAFTFTLTSSTCTAPTSVQPAISANHFYGPSCSALNPLKPVADDFISPLKPSIEFTFSLTSTTASEPRTVQSQYTNSTILAPTMTTPSYDTYGYYHKNVSKPSNYCASFNVLDPLLAAEKPATSFTFSLTSSTKTEPSYAQSSLVMVPTNTPQTYETTPKLATKHHTQHSMDYYPAKQDSTTKVDKVNGHTHRPVAAPNGLQQQTPLHSSQPQTAPSAASTHQHSSQSKYDVSWMAAGAHDAQSSTAPETNQQPTQQSYDLLPPQIISSLDFTPSSGGYTGSSNYKSDIFFAHPPGDEHNLTWSSPSKLSNILNDSSSPYFPPVTLPSLNGDLALNTSGNTGSRANASGACKSTKKSYVGPSTGTSGVGTNQNETPAGSSFLSVSQLVAEPSKSFSNHNHIASNGHSACQQKPVNNNYSAEALIGTACNSHTAQSSVAHENVRKDKIFDYPCTPHQENASGASGALTFSFETYGNASGMDYNKGYNFGQQQNGYVSTFGDAGYGIPVGGSSCAVSNTAAVTPGLSYYGKSSTSQGYYNQPSASNIEPRASSSTSASAANYPNPTHPQSATGGAAVSQDFTAYYLPSFGEKTLPGKPNHHGDIVECPEQAGVKGRKSQKANPIVPPVDYVFPPPVVSAPVAGSMRSNPSYGYTALGNALPATGCSSASSAVSTSQVDPLSYSNYHPHPHQHEQQQQQRLSNQQQYGSGASEAFSSIATPATDTRKAATTSSYSHTQYTPGVVGFDSNKPVKSTQPIHHDTTHHQQPPSYPSVSHQLNGPSCIAASPSISYDNAQTGTSQPGSIYGHASTHHPYHHRQQSHQSNHHQQPEQQQQQQQQQHQHQQQGPESTAVVASNSGNSLNAIPGSGNTITNFNLSTICPEINEKTARSVRDGRTTAATASTVPIPVAAIMTHW